MPFCPECGTSNESDTRFCANCGHQLSQPDTPPTKSAAAASPTPPPPASTLAPPPPLKPAPAKKAGGTNWLWPAAAAVLLIGLIVTGVLFFNKSGQLNESQAKVASLESDISGLETDITGLEADVAARMSEIAALEQELTAEETRAAGLETELASEKTKLATTEAQLSDARGDITALEAAAVTAQARITTIEADLATSSARVSTLETDLAKANTDLDALIANYNKVIAPRHFNSLSELTTWLAADDTDTRYSTLGAADIAFILQVRALRDGFLLPVGIDWDADYIYTRNTSVIGDTIYLVGARTDQVIKGAIFSNPPMSQPLP